MKIVDFDTEPSCDTYTFELDPSELTEWNRTVSLPLSGNTFVRVMPIYGDDYSYEDFEFQDPANEYAVVDAPEALRGNDLDTIMENLLAAYFPHYRDALAYFHIEERTKAAAKRACAKADTSIELTPPLFATSEEADDWLEAPTPAPIRDQIIRTLSAHLPEITAAVVITEIANSIVALLQED